MHVGPGFANTDRDAGLAIPGRVEVNVCHAQETNLQLRCKAEEDARAAN